MVRLNVCESRLGRDMERKTSTSKIKLSFINMSNNADTKNQQAVTVTLDELRDGESYH